MSTGKLTLQKYVTTPGDAARVSKFAAKHVGAATIAFTAKDILTSVSNKKYKGAAFDLVGGIAGVAAGIVIGAAVTSAVAAIGLPVILGSVIAFSATVAVGAYIDNRISRKREEIYGS